ncbi:putative ribonuclease H-like domain-containing protein [Senna tora]|uniref:Putative ribonuclease H-like domain-containing protein n=1 Tax=Senna tora TaxID=362788 RepID=A0A834XEI5_9FABA|nr:putative ribonuclease H-like domain-containing protein [Senna tora]
MKTDSGYWISDEEALKELVCSYYKSLYSKEGTISMPSVLVTEGSYHKKSCEREFVTSLLWKEIGTGACSPVCSLRRWLLALSPYTHLCLTLVVTELLGTHPQMVNFQLSLPIICYKRDWIRANISNTAKEWNTRFALSVWTIWKQRNEVIFNNKSRSPVSIKMMTENYLAGVREVGLIRLSEIGCGGTLRDYNGRWLTGFAKSMGYGSPVLAEAWAIKIGLELARKSSIQNLILESDSLVVINMVKNGVEKDHPLFTIITSIRELAAKDWNVTFSHTLREGNRVANLLANLAHRSPNGLQVWEIPPSICISTLQDDVRGTWLPRGFSG